MPPLTGTAVTTGENWNVKLVHCTRQTNPNDPIQLVFSYVGEEGIEEILTAEVPGAYLFTLIQEQGWFTKTPGVRKMGLARKTG
jgi:hypothetical protein